MSEKTKTKTAFKTSGRGFVLKMLPKRGKTTNELKGKKWLFRLQINSGTGWSPLYRRRGRERFRDQTAAFDFAALYLANRRREGKTHVRIRIVDAMGYAFGEVVPESVITVVLLGAGVEEAPAVESGKPVRFRGASHGPQDLEGGET